MGSKAFNIQLCLTIAGLAFSTLGSAKVKDKAYDKVEVINWSKVESYPHDPTAYTQGLVYWEPGILAESTGLYGQSRIRRVELSTGKALAEAPLPSEFFGEGLVRLGSSQDFLQLTWRESKILHWQWSAKQNWILKEKMTFLGEAWGLEAIDGKELLVSDGSDQIKVIDAKSFKVDRTIQVTMGSHKIDRLNELEMIGGDLFANRYHTTQIMRINIKTGFVTGILDLHELVPKEAKLDMRDAVLNGMAWNPTKKILYVTGKHWPTLYALRLSGY